jgi:hypothetical protein
VDDLGWHLVVADVSLPKAMGKSGNLIDFRLRFKEIGSERSHAHATHADCDTIDAERGLDPFQRARRAWPAK